jgi:hypothetical protein
LLYWRPVLCPSGAEWREGNIHSEYDAFVGIRGYFFVIIIVIIVVVVVVVIIIVIVIVLIVDLDGLCRHSFILNCNLVFVISLINPIQLIQIKAL